MDRLGRKWPWGFFFHGNACFRCSGARSRQLSEKSSSARTCGTLTRQAGLPVPPEERAYFLSLSPSSQKLRQQESHFNIRWKNRSALSRLLELPAHGRLEGAHCGRPFFHKPLVAFLCYSLFILMASYVLSRMISALFFFFSLSASLSLFISTCMQSKPVVWNVPHE